MVSQGREGSAALVAPSTEEGLDPEPPRRMAFLSLATHRVKSSEVTDQFVHYKAVCVQAGQLEAAKAQLEGGAVEVPRATYIISMCKQCGLQLSIKRAHVHAGNLRLHGMKCPKTRPLAVATATTAAAAPGRSPVPPSRTANRTVGPLQRGFAKQTTSYFMKPELQEQFRKLLVDFAALTGMSLRVGLHTRVFVCLCRCTSCTCVFQEVADHETLRDAARLFSRGHFPEHTWPSRNTVSNEVVKSWTSRLTLVRDTVQKVQCLTVVVDGWTMKGAARGFVGTCILFTHPETQTLVRELVSLSQMETYKEDAGYIAECVRQALLKVGVDLNVQEQKAKVLAMVSDTVAVMPNAADILELEWQGCLSHMFNLCFTCTAVQVHHKVPRTSHSVA